MKKIIFLIVICVYCRNISIAQTSLQVSDISVYPIDTLATARIRISAKINNISKTRTIHFLLSSIAVDSSDVLSASANRFSQGGSDFLQYNDAFYPIHNGRFFVVVNLSKVQFRKLKYVAAYAKDLSGVATQHISVKIK